MAVLNLTTPASNAGTHRSGSDILARLGAASGAAAFVLAIGAIVIGASTGTAAANPGAAVDEIARAYASLPTQLVWIAAYVQVLAFLLLFGFTSYVGTHLSKESSTSSQWLASVATGAGQAFVIVTLVGFGIGGVARFRAGPGLDLSVAMALFDVHVAVYVVSWALSVLFLGVTAVLGLRSRALPVWLCVAAALIAVVNLAAVAVPTTPLAGFPNLLMWLWTLAASVALFVRPAASARQ